MTATADQVGPSPGADRPSLLAMNPDNPAATARRRAALLNAFDALPANVRADLLELIESAAYSQSTTVDRLAVRDMRLIVDEIYRLGGLLLCGATPSSCSTGRT